MKGWPKGRPQRPDSHIRCKHGHDYSHPGVLYMNPNGSPECNRCKNARRGPDKRRLKRKLVVVPVLETDPDVLVFREELARRMSRNVDKKVFDIPA